MKIKEKFLVIVIVVVALCAAVFITRFLLIGFGLTDNNEDPFLREAIRTLAALSILEFIAGFFATFSILRDTQTAKKIERNLVPLYVVSTILIVVVGILTQANIITCSQLSLLLVLIFTSVTTVAASVIENYHDQTKLDTIIKAAASYLLVVVIAPTIYLPDLKLFLFLCAAYTLASSFFSIMNYRKVIRISSTDTMNGAEFQQHLEKRFKKLGYNTTNSSSLRYYEVDFMLKRNNKLIFVQGIKSQNPICTPAIMRALVRKEYSQADECWIVTNSSYSEHAAKLASEAKAVLLDCEWLTAKKCEAQKELHF